jgi:hypothetical protein
MKKRFALAACSLFLLFTLVNCAYAEESFTDKLLGSPLLVLAILLVIVLIALLYHKLRK